MERAGVLLMLLLAASASRAQRAPLRGGGADDAKGCPPCDRTACPSPTCPAGRVLPGPCFCCHVCALEEGQTCFNRSIRGLPPPLSGRPYLPCGENLECLLRKDLAPRDVPEALCTCKQSESVCGSDDQTYENMCQLREAAVRDNYRSGPLNMKNWGPCMSVPDITGPPDDTSGPLHSEVALGCEAKGNPIPDIHWEFSGDNGDRRNLPSDDQSVSVQVRGGPDAYMVTSWVQIMNLQVNFTGTYTCVATNDLGSSRADAHISVYLH
ncbi:Hypothetical predicted protein [Cloeon dipterum]|uniref:Kazal-like domain-containing protein n=2 Tax=Cloeon dipterum TaxID=197152 RepID=A0A8S1DDE9_9INSE|nr:Hypothetical predicted protein [Cloeon dipterum]